MPEDNTNNSNMVPETTVIGDNEKIAARDPSTRTLLVIGCGDGGSNIAAAITAALPQNAYTLIYNTTERAMNKRLHNIIVRPEKVIDGSGKDRKYADNVFKTVTGKKFMEKIAETVDKLKQVDYIIIVGTADGGTGSGTLPTAIRLLQKNLSIPIVAMGVYPSISEDAMSQFNAIQWQTEITELGVPYILLDNNLETPKTFDQNQPGEAMRMHEETNGYAVSIARLLAGTIFGDTDISIIDNRNLLKLIHQIGKRIVIAVDENRPSGQCSLDEHMEKILSRCYQALPENATGMGLFVKGPQDYIDRVDISARRLQEKYGNALLKFAHVQVSNEPATAIILSGCGEATERLIQMKGKYNDVMRSIQTTTNKAADLASEMVNPLGEMSETSARKKELDFSVLDS